MDIPARRRAAALSGHRGDPATARSLLDDPDPTVRATALGALLRSDSLTDGDLGLGLADPSPAVRRRAVEAVAALGGSGPAAGVAIIGLLDDPDSTVVETAAWASGERAPAEAGAVGRLMILAGNHSDALVREAAVAALGSIGDPSGLPAVLAGLADKATVRRRAVVALAAFDGPEVDAALAQAAVDRDWQVRQAAEDLGAPPDPH